MRHGAVIAMMFSLTVAAAGPAEAQRSRLFPSLNLSEEDLALLGEAADRVYEKGEVGASESWDNAASGNSGSASLLEMFERDGLQCRTIEHVVSSQGRGDPTRAVLSTCLDHDGIWKMV